MTKTVTYDVEYEYPDNNWRPCRVSGSSYADEASARAALAEQRRCKDGGFPHRITKITTTTTTAIVTAVLPDPPARWVAGETYGYGFKSVVYHVSEVLPNGNALVRWERADGTMFCDFISVEVQSNYRKLQG